MELRSVLPLLKILLAPDYSALKQSCRKIVIRKLKIRKKNRNKIERNNRFNRKSKENKSIPKKSKIFQKNRLNRYFDFFCASLLPSNTFLLVRVVSAIMPLLCVAMSTKNNPPSSVEHPTLELRWHYFGVGVVN